MLTLLDTVSLQISALVNMGEANIAFRHEVAVRNSLDYGMNWGMLVNGGMVRAINPKQCCTSQ